ncbi:MAG: hypothetical protein JWQ52_62 [Phenylobacterium sp.]|jgi:hypothetical protein|nr:hypothetical protein [Phenylobacterium sp.]
MKLQTLAAACAAIVTLSAGSAAFAGDTVTAKLQQPVAEKTKFIAGGAMFVCEADACLAQAPTSQTFSTAACKTIAGKVGPLASFGGDRKQLEAARLGDCNSVAVARAAASSQLAKQ